MTNDDGVGESDAAGRLEALLDEARSDIRAEVERLVRTGEASFERLARQLAETVVREILSGALSTGGAADNASANLVATSIARATRRGARFL